MMKNRDESRLVWLARQDGFLNERMVYGLMVCGCCSWVLVHNARLSFFIVSFDRWEK
jgi:hypothetical protein